MSGAPARASPEALASLVGLFAPVGATPDYTVTQTRGAGALGGGGVEVVRRRGDWVRVDRREGALRASQYIFVPAGLVAEIGDNEAGRVRYLSLRAAVSSADKAAGGGRTDETLQIAGETCRVWTAYRNVEDPRRPFRQLSCLTADGIELARFLDLPGAGRQVEAQATRLERGAVADQVVRPPPQDWKAWVGGGAAERPRASGAEDFEVVLARDDGALLIAHRRLDWTSEEQREPDGSARLAARTSDGKRSVRAILGAGGRPLELFARVAEPGLKLGREAIDRAPEEALGLACAWVRVTTGEATNGQQECRTGDGVPLIILVSRQGETRRYEAVRLDRRRLTIEELLPPRRLLDVSVWGATPATPIKSMTVANLQSGDFVFI